MKILLIIPPVTVKADEHIPRNCYPSLGVAYLAAVLEQVGYEVAILDAFTTQDNKPNLCGVNATYGMDGISIKRQIERLRPEIVGVTNMYTMYAQDAHRMASIAKEVNKDILVIFGGSHPSCNPEMVLQDKNVDIVVRGEGEYALLDIVNALNKGGNIYNIEGTITRRDGSIFTNNARPLVDDLDTLPLPARHLLPMEKYFYNAKHSTLYNMRNPFTTLISSRGCPMHCVYCAVKTIWGRTWRARSAIKVVDEIECLVKNYSVKEIHFSDDNISVNKNRIIEICNEIIKRKLNIRWACPTGIAIWSIDEDILRIMKKAGCYRLTFGLESGNRQTLDFIGKKYSYDKAKELIKLANRMGFWTASTFIFGFPHEKQESINDTISLAADSDLDFSVFYTPIIFPGTRLFDVYQEEGIKYRPEITGVNSAYDSLYFSSDELFRMRGEANSLIIRKRLRNPFKFFIKIRNAEDFRYTVRIGCSFMKNLIVNYASRNTAFGLLHRTKAKERTDDDIKK